MNIDDFFPNKVNPLKISKNELKIFNKKFKDNKSLNFLLSLEDLLYKVFPYMNEVERKHKLFYGLLLSENHLILRQVINLLTKKEIQELNILRNDIIKIGNPKICLNQISCGDNGEFQKYHYILKDNLKEGSIDVKILPLGEIIMEKGETDDNKEDYLDYTISKKKINSNNDQQNQIYHKKIITNIFMSICEDMKLCINCKIKLIRDFNFYLSKLYNYNNLYYKITVKNIASIVEFQPLHAWKNTKFVKGLGNQEIKSKVNIKFLLERMCKNLTLIKTENPRKTVIEALIYEDINNLKILINDEIEFIKEKDINLIKRQISNILVKFDIKDIDIDSLLKPYSLTSVIDKHFKPIHIQIKNLDFLGKADLAKDKQFINQLELLFKDYAIVTKDIPSEKINSKFVKKHESSVKPTIIKRKYHENIKNKLNSLNKSYLNFHDKCELVCGSENWFRIKSGLTLIIITYLYLKITQIIWTDEPLYEEIIKSMEFDKDVKDVNNLSNNTNVPRVFKRNYHQSFKKENKDKGVDLSLLLKLTKERDERVDFEKLNEKELDFILEQYKASSPIFLSSFEKIENTTKNDLKNLDEFIAEEQKKCAENSIRRIDLALIEKDKLIKNFEEVKNVKDYYFNMYTKLESLKREKLIRILKRDYHVNYKLQNLHDNRISFENAFLNKNVLKTPKVEVDKIYKFGRKSAKFISKQTPVIIENVGRAGEYIYTNSPEIKEPSKKIGGFLLRTTKNVANSSLNTTVDIANNLTETTADLAQKFYKTGLNPSRVVNQQMDMPKVKLSKKQIDQVKKFEADTLADLEKLMKERENTLILEKKQQKGQLPPTLFQTLFTMYNKNIFNVIIFYIKATFLFLYNNISYYLTYMRMCIMRRYSLLTFPPIINTIYNYYLNICEEIKYFITSFSDLIIKFWYLLDSLGLIWKILIFTAVLTLVFFCFRQIINFILLPFRLLKKLYNFLFSYKHLAEKGKEIEIKNDLIIRNLIKKEKEKRSFLNRIFKRNYYVNYKLQKPNPFTKEDIIKLGKNFSKNAWIELKRQQKEEGLVGGPRTVVLNKMNIPIPETPRGNNFGNRWKLNQVKGWFTYLVSKKSGNNTEQSLISSIFNRNAPSVVYNLAYNLGKAFVWQNLSSIGRTTRDAALGMGVSWFIKRLIGFVVFAGGAYCSSQVPVLKPVIDTLTTGTIGGFLTAGITDVAVRETPIHSWLFKQAQTNLLQLPPGTMDNVNDLLTNGTGTLATSTNDTTPPISTTTILPQNIPTPILPTNIPTTDIMQEPITNITQVNTIEEITDTKSFTTFEKVVIGAGVISAVSLVVIGYLYWQNPENAEMLIGAGLTTLSGIGSVTIEKSSELKEKVSGWFFNTFFWETEVSKTTLDEGFKAEPDYSHSSSSSQDDFDIASQKDPSSSSVVPSSKTEAQLGKSIDITIPGQEPQTWVEYLYSFFIHPEDQTRNKTYGSSTAEIPSENSEFKLKVGNINTPEIKEEPIFINPVQIEEIYSNSNLGLSDSVVASDIENVKIGGNQNEIVFNFSESATNQKQNFLDSFKSPRATASASELSKVLHEMKQKGIKPKITNQGLDLSDEFEIDLKIKKEALFKSINADLIDKIKKNEN